jgi:hypothetical protein
MKNIVSIFYLFFLIALISCNQELRKKKSATKDFDCSICHPKYFYHERIQKTIHFCAVESDTADDEDNLFPTTLLHKNSGSGSCEYENYEMGYLGDYTKNGCYHKCATQCPYENKCVKNLETPTVD